MDKKGVSVRQILYTVYILLAMWFLVTSINYISSFRDESGFNKEYDVRNIALLIDTAYLAQGNLQINYNSDLNYIYDIENGFVKLSRTNELLPSTYRYIESDFYEINFDSKGEKEKITILKEDGELVIKYD